MCKHLCNTHTTHGEGSEIGDLRFLAPSPANGNRVPNSMSLWPGQAMIRSFVSLRSPKELDPGDIFFMLDGGSHSYRAKMMNCFIDDEGAALKKNEKLVYPCQETIYPPISHTQTV